MIFLKLICRKTKPKVALGVACGHLLAIHDQMNFKDDLLTLLNISYVEIVFHLYMLFHAWYANWLVISNELFFAPSA
jgi:hypothetical protein